MEDPKHQDQIGPEHAPAPHATPVVTRDDSEGSRPAPVEHERAGRRRHRRRRFAGWREDRLGQPLATVLLGALLVGAPQLLGGVLPWTTTAIAAASLVCLAVVGLRAPVAAQRFPRLGLVLLGVYVWTAIQGTPLPCELVKAVSPASHSKLTSLREILGDSNAGACTISQDPGATQLELIKGLAIVATFVTSWFFAANGGRRRLLWLIAGSTLVMSVVALAHGLLELDRVFGIYTPVGITRNPLLAPLMNPNNLGAFAALGVPLWIGLGYRAESDNVRMASYVALGLTSVTAVLSLSRGAIGQLLASVVIMIYLVYRKRTQQKKHTRAALPLREIALAAAGAAGLGLGAYLVGDEALRDFRSSRLDKLGLGLRALQFAWSHAWTGVGRGAFASVFVGVEGAQARYRYAENFIAQWSADWGLPVTLVLVGSITYELIRAIRRSQSLAHLSACTALFAFAAQNLVDFGLEMLGPTIVAAALLAACTAPWPDELPRTPDPAESVLRRGSTVGALLLAVGLALLGLLGPRVMRQSVPALTAELRHTLAQGDRIGFKQQLSRALAAHPSEPVLTLLAASESLTYKDPKTLAWLNRAMQLAPGWALPHEMAFRWLWQHGQGRQALLELKAAASINANIALDAACRLGKVDANWALDAAPGPQSDQRALYLDAVSGCIPLGAQSDVFDAVVLREMPNALNSLWHEVQRRFDQGEVDEAMALIDRVHAMHPDNDNVPVIRFEMLLTAGRLREIVDQIDNAMVGVKEDKQVRLLRVKALALARSGSMELAGEVLTEMRRRASTDPPRLAASYVLAGEIHMERKEPGEALAAYREAYRISSDNTTLHNIANIAESLGDRAQALWAYVNLCQREPLGGACERRNALLSAASSNSRR